MSTEVNQNNNSSAGETPKLTETTGPSGMNLRPEPEEVVRISKQVGIFLVALAVLLCCVLAYSGITRQKQRTAAALSGPHKKVEPAKPDEVQQGLTLPAAANRLPMNGQGPVSPADQTPLQSPPTNVSGERVVVRSLPAPRSSPLMPVASSVREATPEERAIAAAYASEQQARLAPTSIRTGASGSSDRGFSSGVPGDPMSPLQALARNIGTGTGRSAAPAQPAASKTEYEEQNLQNQKEAFLEKARLGNVGDNYLKFTRTPPMSRFEIKAGWEIPAVLEQALNSDFPGELKALVMSNVYDTATGLYLLIPQGSRLVGVYNSRVGYAQNGVQVAWSRIIFPDASAIDLNGMNGLDSRGNAGLRDEVDRHYKQLFGFAVLTSMFDAALAITQNRQQSVLVYPSATQETESAAGREVSQFGTQITRKNLNVQPRVKIRAGYKFNVRVNRDILFESPYEPVQDQQQAFESQRSH